VCELPKSESSGGGDKSCASVLCQRLAAAADREYARRCIDTYNSGPDSGSDADAAAAVVVPTVEAPTPAPTPATAPATVDDGKVDDDELGCKAAKYTLAYAGTHQHTLTHIE
jgi:hypothetical protein